MNKSKFLLAFSFAAAALALAAPALQAKPNDLTLNRLVTDEHGDPITTDCSRETCVPNQQEFRNLMREFGYAIAPMKLLPAETHGFGGGSFGILGHVTFISSDQDYWKNGVQEKSPPGALFLFQASSQFILIPYFLEWGFTIGYLFTTSDTTIGFNVKTSPFEGFRKKALGALPDISFGFGLNRLIGDDEVSLTTGTADVGISYAFAPGGVIVLTPFIDISFVGVVAESELVDSTPFIKQSTGQDYSVSDNPPVTNTCPIHAGGNGVQCAPGTGNTLDFNNNLKFTREWMYFVRVTYGVRLIYELLSITVAGSHGHQFSREDNDPSNTIGQLSFSVGLDF
jgi:hypothetical protein